MANHKDTEAQRPQRKNHALFCDAVPLWFLLIFTLASPLHAQAQDDWVGQINAQIDKLRKTDMRVIVLDAQGRPVPGAVVRIEQLRHDFTIGFVLGEAGFPQAEPDTPVLRCFNAVSLEHWTDWSRLQSGPLDEPDFSAVDRLVDQAELAGLTIRWGGLISADAARNPQWVSFLEGPKLAAALEDHVKGILLRYGGRVDAFDLYTHSLDHSFVEDRLGAAMLRRLHQHARAAAPHAAIALRLENCLAERRLRRAIQHADAMRQAFIPFNEVSISQRIGGLLMQRQLSHGLEMLGELGADVVIGPLEVGGSSDGAAASNLETLLRACFASKPVRGIYFAGLTVDDVADPTAALLDNAGRPLLPGQMVDDLFHSEWWTNETHAADELGNVYTRVFAGTHRVTAILPGGQTLSMTVYLQAQPPPGLSQHIVLLEPMKK